jgi:aerotaxis receptor
LLAAARQISEGYLTYRFVPLNLLVHAGQIGEAGAAIATISTNYNTLSEEIERGLEGFLEAAIRVSHTINVGAFLLATSYVQQEIAASFRQEAAIEGVDHATEKNYLNQQQLTYQGEALKSLTGIEQELKSFFEMVSEMRRLASGLAAIRIMGKVESGRLSVGVVKDLIMDLEAFQDIVQSGLSDILQANSALKLDTSRLLEAYAIEDV